MHIDGGPAITRYGNGAQDQLLPLACDGKSHTYTLVARNGAASASKSLTITTIRQ